MNKSEINEIKRALKPERSGCPRFYGNYVNAEGNSICSFERSVGLMTEEECAQYHGFLRKALSGSLNRTLFELEFNTKQVAEGEQHKLLSDLVDSGCEDEAQREKLFQAIRESIQMDTNYIILLGFVAYDVPKKRADGEMDTESSDEVFHFITCGVCPVKQAKTGLGYDHGEKAFTINAGAYLAGNPVLGFTFPAFDKRCANIYGALLYSKADSSQSAAFSEYVFGVKGPKTEDEQKSAFALALEQMGDECNVQMVNRFSGEAAAKMEQDASAALSLSDMKELLKDCGAGESAVENFSAAYEEQFGQDTALNPDIVLGTKKSRIDADGISIVVSGELAQRISTRVFDNDRYLMIPVPPDTDQVKVNGVMAHLS